MDHPNSKTEIEKHPALDASVLVSTILRGGVMVSSIALILGLLLSVIQFPHVSSQTLIAYPKTFNQLLVGLLQFHAQAVITFGLFLLIATPVIRVALSIIIFLREKDRNFVFITTVVLLILLLSIFYISGLLGHSSFLPSIHFSYSDMIILFILSIAAGLLGSLVGLGGAFLLIPVLTLLFHFPMYFAIGSGLISVIATSSDSATTYLKEHLVDLRVGMFLETATTIGAICGAFLAGLLDQNILFVIFGIILLLSSIPLIFERNQELPHGVKNDHLATYLHLNNSYFDSVLNRTVLYNVTRTWIGLIIMYLAGGISGLLGIGSGTFKVLALDGAMRLPMKVSTTTSNFMIGVTAAASVGIYFARGDVLPLLVLPIALGTLFGAFIGAKILTHLSNRRIRYIFLIIILFTAAEMIMRGV